MNPIVKAIRKLRPSSEFVITGNDLENIDWHVLEGDIPTKAEIEAAIEKVIKEEADKIEADKVTKAALLERLGITEDEAKLLLG